MKTNNNKELIISLIRDNLINTKLLLGLNNLGLIADDYALHLGDTVFELMGFEINEHNDFLFEKVFLANSAKVMYIDFSGSKDELTRLSMEIYKELLFAKEQGH